MENNAKIDIRKARPEDAAFIAKVVLAAMGEDSFGAERDTENRLVELTKAVAEAAEQDDTLYSWRNTDIIIYNCAVAGAMVSYDGATYADAFARTFSLISGNAELDFDPEIIGNSEPETSEGEYYLDSMAVAPEFRGHGIGGILIQNALETAEGLGFDRASLLVDPKKPWLVKLYTKLGFTYECKRTFMGTEFDRMVQEI